VPFSFVPGIVSLRRWRPGVEDEMATMRRSRFAGAMISLGVILILIGAFLLLKLTVESTTIRS